MRANDRANTFQLKPSVYRGSEESWALVAWLDA